MGKLLLFGIINFMQVLSFFLVLSTVKQMSQSSIFCEESSTKMIHSSRNLETVSRTVWHLQRKHKYENFRMFG